MPDNDAPGFTVSIVSIPSDDAREGVLSFLQSRLSGQSADTLSRYLDNLPLLLTRNADQRSVQALKKELESLGVEFRIEPSHPAGPDKNKAGQGDLPGQVQPQQPSDPLPVSGALPQGAICPRHQGAPAVSICARCGDFVCQACAFPAGGYSYCPECIQVVYNYWKEMQRRIPWDDRKQTGFLRSMVQTIRLLLSHPRTFFQKMPRQGGVGSPIIFAISIALIVAVINIGMFWLLAPYQPMQLYQNFPLGKLGLFLYNSAVLLLGASLGNLIVYVIYAVVYYISAYLLGARPTFETMFRMVLFVGGSLEVLSLVMYPMSQMFYSSQFIILPLFLMWGLVYAAMHITYMYFGYKEVLEMSAGRAIVGACSMLIFSITLIISITIVVVVVISIIGLL